MFIVRGLVTEKKTGNGIADENGFRAGDVTSRILR